MALPRIRRNVEAALVFTDRSRIVTLTQLVNETQSTMQARVIRVDGLKVPEQSKRFCWTLTAWNRQSQQLGSLDGYAHIVRASL
jgi:hypothetical protein